MALIPVVGRKTWNMRALIGALYLVLTLGAVTMVYPFLVMLGASVESQYEKTSYDLIPRYLHSNTALFGKYAEDKYRGDIVQINATYGADYAGLQDVVPPSAADTAAVDGWNRFAAALPARYQAVGFGGAAAAFSPSPLLDRYHSFLRDHFHGDIRALDRAYAQEDEDFLTVFPPFEQPTKHNWTPDYGVKYRDWKAFEATLPANYFLVVGADPLYQKWLKEEAYPSLDALNTAWGTKARAYTVFTFPARPEGDAAERKDWQTFVRTKLPFRDIVVGPSAVAAYQAFLQTRYKNSIADYNLKHHAQAASFAMLPLPDPETIPSQGPPLLDWIDFLKVAPVAALSGDTPETRWRGQGGGKPISAQSNPKSGLRLGLCPVQCRCAAAGLHGAQLQPGHAVRPAARAGRLGYGHLLPAGDFIHTARQPALCLRPFAV